jgi:uncharacterized protein (DUF2235 family)
MPKNIVICADGTNEKFSDRNTNVVRLYSVLDLSNPAEQIAYYHAGLGTMGAPNALSQWSKRWTKVKGLAFGYGLTDAIGHCYSFLMDVYEPGDRLFLFGFSRGAYTVRALSAMLHFLGLIRQKDYNLIAYATEMLKTKLDDDVFRLADEFKATFSRECKSYFEGVWDTVSSVGWVWDPMHLPYTAKNPDLSIGRQAVSIDERRVSFRQNLWEVLPGQDIKQVWFAGEHTDVGGGYADAENGLSKITLEWMLCEACQAGLKVDRAKVATILGYSGNTYSRPDASAILHNSLSGPWLLLEALPHRYYDKTCHPPEKWRLPLGRRRQMLPGAVVHDSVRQKIALGTGYNPPNVPAVTEQEPWVRWNQSPCV